MTRITEKYTKEATYTRELDAICDKCGDSIEDVDGKNHEDRDFELFFLRGNNYGTDGVDKEGWEVPDLCDGCVEDLKTLLENEGYNVVKKEQYW